MKCLQCIYIFLKVSTKNCGSQRAEVKQKECRCNAKNCQDDILHNLVKPCKISCSFYNICFSDYSNKLAAINHRKPLYIFLPKHLGYFIKCYIGRNLQKIFIHNIP